MADANNSPGGAGFMDKVKDGAVSQLTRQKDRTSDGIGSVVSAVRQSTHQLRDEQHDTLAEYVDEAAGQLERFSNGLKEKNIGELLEDAQQFARRNPALFVGGAFALGILSARFFKSSHDRNGAGDWRERFPGESRDYSGGPVSQAPRREYGRGDVAQPTGAVSYDPGRS
jgi:hypothetical protein